MLGIRYWAFIGVCLGVGVLAQSSKINGNWNWGSGQGKLDLVLEGTAATGNFSAGYSLRPPPNPNGITVGGEDWYISGKLQGSYNPQNGDLRGSISGIWEYEGYPAGYNQPWPKGNDAPFSGNFSGKLSGQTISGNWSATVGTASDTASSTPQPPATLSGTFGVTLSGKPPCPAAVRAFNLNPNQPTSMPYNLDDLQKQFGEAIDRYNQNASKKAFRKDNVGGVVPSISWLAHQGGTVDMVSKQFVFASDADRNNWSKQASWKKPDLTLTKGTERRLESEIINFAQQNKRKLTPGDVLYLALQQRDGDVKDALLLAHNTLRSLARVNDGPLTEVHQDLSFFDNYLEPLIANESLGRGQNAGAVYHLFGTAYFEMQTRGEWGPNTFAQLTFDGISDAMFAALSKINQLLKNDPEAKLPNTRSSLSVLANEVEQLYRKYKDGQQNDPEKYCINVWGSQLGAWLYKNKLAATPQGSPNDPIFTIFGPIPRSLSGEKVVFDASPLNITWEGNGYKMTLDQASQNLSGYYPLKLIPYYEPDSKTWGVLWVDLLQKPYKLTLTATQNGVAHIGFINPGNGLQMSTLSIKPGESFSVTVQPNAPLVSGLSSSKGQVPFQVIGGPPEEKVFSNGNIYAVNNGPTAPTRIRLNKALLLTKIVNYHWNSAKGQAPGTIALRHENGTTYGPWQTAGSPGQGGVPNAYWTATPNVTLPAGTYTVTDSHPASWAQNSASGGQGFTELWGYWLTQGQSLHPLWVSPKLERLLGGLS